MTNPTYEPIDENENLNLPATRGDLLSLATKTDLEFFRQEINEKLDNLPTKEDFSQLLNSVDRLAGQVENSNTEKTVEIHRLERIEKWIKKAGQVINLPAEF